VLALRNRLTSPEDFSRTTKQGVRSATQSLAGYLLTDTELNSPKIGYIVSRTIGGSVVRHKVTRQLKHISRENLNTLPTDSLVVIRATKNSTTYSEELPSLFLSLKNKKEKQNQKSASQK